MHLRDFVRPIFKFSWFILFAGLTQDTPSPEQMIVGQRYGNKVLVPSNQLLNPTGNRIEFPGRPVDMALAPDGQTVAVRLTNSIQIRSITGELVRSISTDPSSFMGIAFSPDGHTVVAPQLPSNGNHSLIFADPYGQLASFSVPLPANSVPAGLAFDTDGRTLFVALNRDNKVVRIDVATGQITGSIDVGVAPLGIAIAQRGDRIFVTNWGGRRPRPGEPTALSSGTPVLVDSRGVASNGTLSIIDTSSFRVIGEVPLGLHPGTVQLSPNGLFAVVANANSDTITFVDTSSFQVLDTVRIPSLTGNNIGSCPTALAFDAWGEWLYVACSGINAVALMRRNINALQTVPETEPIPRQGRSRRSQPEAGLFRLVGFAPVDWYPIAVVAPTNGNSVIVANAKGIGARWKGRR